MKTLLQIILILCIAFTPAVVFPASNPFLDLLLGLPGGEAPVAPELTVEVSGNQALVSWPAVDGASGYRLYTAPYTG